MLAWLGPQAGAPNHRMHLWPACKQCFTFYLLCLELLSTGECAGPCVHAGSTHVPPARNGTSTRLRTVKYTYSNCSICLGAGVPVKQQLAGQLELRDPFSGQWGAVCSDGFGVHEAAVACAALGFGKGVRLLYGDLADAGLSLNDTALPIVVTGLACNGYEEVPAECAHDAWGVSECNEDMGRALVLCLGGSVWLPACNVRITSDQHAHTCLHGWPAVVPSGRPHPASLPMLCGYAASQFKCSSCLPLASPLLVGSSDVICSTTCAGRASPPFPPQPPPSPPNPPRPSHSSLSELLLRVGGRVHAYHHMLLACGILGHAKHTS